MTKEERIEKICKRFSRLELNRTNFEQFFRDVRDYIRPTKQGVDTSVITVGQRHTNNRYDSTASEAARIMVIRWQL